MAYATKTDIESEFKNITFATSGTTITEAEINSFIDQEEGLINMTIGNRYVVPVTAGAAESVKVLKKISIDFVAYRVAKILNLKKDVPVMRGDTPQNFVAQTLNEGASYKLSMSRLLDIRDGKIILSDAEARDGGGGVKSYNSDNSIYPVWERDTKQW